MKILYCITSSSWGGAQLHVLELCKDQVRRGNQVVFVVGNNGLLLKKVKNIKGVEVFVVPTMKREVSPFNDIKTIFKLQKIIRKEKPDIVHLHSSKAGTLGRLAVFGIHRHNKPKVIFTVHGWAFTDGVPSKIRRKAYKFVERVMSPLTDAFICVSEFDEKIGIREHVLNKNTRSIVIHNGSPVPKFKEEKVSTTVHNPLRLVMIARFSKQKNQAMLIRAIKNIDKKKYKLVFVGDGETINDCKKLTASLGLNSNVDFVGFKNNIFSYLRDNDVYILTSFYEGLPISIIEAMSYGLPVIASNVGGNSELICNNENGFLVNNEEELVKDISSLIMNPDKVKSMGQKSYSIFLKELTLKTNMDKVNEVYKKILYKSGIENK